MKVRRMRSVLSRWMYRRGRPSRLASILNRAWTVAAMTGLAPQRMATLEVRGRHSGRAVLFPVMVAGYQDDRYLVAMLGKNSSWVSNVRAADGGAVLHHSRGRRENIHLTEIAPGARGPILRRYLEIAPGGRPHIPVDARAPAVELERVAAHYPVFRIDPAP